MNKKIISLILCVLIFIGSISTLRVFAEDYEQLNTVNDFDTANNSEVNYGVFKKGDINLDGNIDIADVVAIAGYVGDYSKNKLEPQGILNGDVHNSGNGLNANDSLMIQQYLANIITEL